MRILQILSSKGYDLFHNNYHGKLKFTYNFNTDDISLYITEKDKITCKLQDFLQDNETPLTTALLGVFAVKSYFHWHESTLHNAWWIDERDTAHLKSFMTFIKSEIMDSLSIGLTEPDSYFYEPVKGGILNFEID